MSETWLPIVTFVLGFVGALVLEQLKERHAARMRWKAAQHEALTGLQENLQQLYVASNEYRRQQNSGAEGDLLECFRLYALSDVFRVRIHNARVRELAEECAERCLDTAYGNFDDPTDAFNAVNYEIGASLRSLS